MRPRSGAAFEIRQRKVWSSSSADGFRNEITCTPCGFTPDMTCSIVESLPAASIAWKTMSTACRSLAHRSSWASLSSFTPRLSTVFAVSFSSWADSPSNSPPPVQRVSRAPRPAGDPGATRTSRRTSSRMPLPVRSWLPT